MLSGLCVLAPVVRGQNGPNDSTGVLTGTIVGREDGSLVPYGTVLLIGTDRTRFADNAGTFTLTRLVPGTYHLRARQIGYSPVDTTVNVGAGPGATTVVIRLPRIALTLAAISVHGHRSNGCVATGVPDSITNAGLATLFAQVRENVDRIRLVLDDYPFRYLREEQIMLRSEPGGDSIESIDTVAYESRSRRAYQVGGVVYNEIGPLAQPRRMMYLPSFGDLADPTFLAAHCFTFGGEQRLGKSKDRMLRVDFQPAGSIKAPDVEGSIFLDAERFIVRRAVFRLTKPESLDPPVVDLTVTSTYRELFPLVPVLDATQSVEPQVQSAGPGFRPTSVTRTTIIDDRLISYTFETGAPGEQPSAPAALSATTAPLGATATVEGRVVRTDGTPVMGAAVGVLASNDSTATGDSGRFVLRNLTPGPHMLWVRGVGFRSTRVTLTLLAARTRSLTITVAPALHTLAPIVTTAQYPAGYAAVGLDKRIQAGVGNILTDSQIEHRHAEKTTQLLQGVRGIHLRYYFDPDARIMSSEGGCVSFVIDGIPQKAMTSHDLDNLVSPDEIGVIEIYSPAEAPIGLGTGVAAKPNQETLKGQSTPSGQQVDVVTGQVTSTLSGIQETCAVMAIWTRAKLGLAPGGEGTDSGFRATATRAPATSGTAVFPNTDGRACDPPPPAQATTLDVYAVLQDALPPQAAHDTAWRSYSEAVLGAVQKAFAFPNELELPVFGYAFRPAPTATNLKPKGFVVAPALSGVVSFTLGPTGALLDLRVRASSLSGDADTSILAAVMGAAASQRFPAMPPSPSGRQPVRFDLSVTTTTPDPSERPVVLDQIEVPVWPLARSASWIPNGNSDLRALRAAEGSTPDSVMFELVVDENGKAIMSTVRAISQAGRTIDQSYRGFVARVAHLLPAFQFETAMVGACPVRQVILQPFAD
jgi:hypothetical protein